MNSRKIKKEVISLLEHSDWGKISEELRKFQPRDLINPLFSAICRPENRIRWHGISAFGQVVPQMAEEELEDGRVIMRRFLWSLNDESGGIGWGAPESMGEIICKHAKLAKEYLHMLISYTRDDGPELFQDGNFLELPELQRGLLWGLGRAAVTRAKMLNDLGAGSDIEQYLLSKDPVILSMAIWCLGQLGRTEEEGIIKSYTEDSREVPFYYDGRYIESTVGEFARRALMKFADTN